MPGLLVVSLISGVARYAIPVYFLVAPAAPSILPSSICHTSQTL